MVDKSFKECPRKPRKLTRVNSSESYKIHKHSCSDLYPLHKPQQLLFSGMAFTLGRRFQECCSSGSVTHSPVDFLVIPWSLSHHAPGCNAYPFPVNNPIKLTESPSQNWMQLFLWPDFGSLNRHVFCLPGKGHTTPFSPSCNSGLGNMSPGWGRACFRLLCSSTRLRLC